MAAVLDTRRSILRRIQRALSQLTELEQLFPLLHTELGRVVDTTGFVVGLYREASQMVEIIGQMEGGLELPGGSFPLGHGFLSEVIRTGQSRHIRHWSVDGPRVQVQYATNTPGLPESTITAPLLAGDRVVGVVSVQSYMPNAYAGADLRLLEAVASQVGLAIDAMQRGQASRAVRRVGNLEAVLSSMTDGLLVLDADGRIISLNPPARAIFASMGVAIILGQPLDHEQWGQWPLGAKTVAEALAPVLAALPSGEALRDVEVEVNADGRRVLSFSSAPLSEPSGAHAGGVVIIRDVTTQRDIARLRDDLLSIASHDLRTPATVLKVQAQLMQRELRQPELDRANLQERAQAVLDQTNRLTRMLNMLLDLTRVEAGRIDLRLEPLDLVQHIRRIGSAVQALSPKHRIRIQAPRRVDGLWDSARLEQVIQNLLTNAVKYSPDGGAVTVKIESDRDTVTVAVRDDGLGIAAEELPHLFDRFYRVARTRGLEGSGLGLYVCQGIIAAHSGRIWANSDGPGQGSTFTFSLARNYVHAAEDVETAEAAEAALESVA